MPSTTFFNLPAEKREKLLAAARAEFALVPYPEASINKIIQAADIPRGSFYMYFKDKEELFVHLLSAYLQAMANQMRGELQRNGGDLFAAFVGLFDAVQTCYRDPGADQLLQNLVDIIRNNMGMQLTALMGPEDLGDRLLSDLLPHIDLSRLDLREEGDLKDVFHLLLGVTGPALGGAILSGSPAEGRGRYLKILDILKRGLAAKPPAPDKSVPEPQR